MTVQLEIIHPGVQTLIQDKGRFGFQEFGIPLCGTSVPHWMELANALVGNKADFPGVEFRLMGPAFRVVSGSVKLAICGEVDVQLISTGPAGTEVRKLSGWRSFCAREGDEVRIGGLKNSAVGFIAFGGGLDIEPQFGSCATYVRSLIGGINGMALQVADVLILRPEAEKQAQLLDQRLSALPDTDNRHIRVVLGPQDDFFETNSVQRFLQEPYVISKAADRMGVRLEGACLKHSGPSEIVSDGIAPGAIQVPGSGLPIVLLNDAQTVGGYPKIATVISTDLHKVANATPGQEITFEAVSAHEACMIARQERMGLENMKKAIVTVSGDGFIDQKALYETNLIGGMVDMANPDHLEEEQYECD